MVVRLLLPGVALLGSLAASRTGWAQPAAAPRSAVAATVEAMGRELLARASARDAAGMAAHIDTTALSLFLRQMRLRTTEPGPRMGALLPSAAQWRELDPGITAQELQLAHALDSLRALRAPGARDVNIMGFALPADSVAAMSARQYLERYLAWSVERTRRMRAMCPPAAAARPAPGVRVRLLGAIVLDDSTAMLIVTTRVFPGAAEPAPSGVLPPEVLPVDLTADGWRARWSMRLMSMLTDNGVAWCG